MLLFILAFFSFRQHLGVWFSSVVSICEQFVSHLGSCVLEKYFSWIYKTSAGLF